MSIITDNRVLVHIYSGVESKNKVTLGLLVDCRSRLSDIKSSFYG